jgi:YbbR domain-containing protein
MTFSVTVGVDDSALRLRQPLTAEVRVDIVPAPAERTIAGVVVAMRGGRDGSSAVGLPATVAVTVRGVQESLAGVTASQIEAFVDLAGLAPGRYNLPVRVDPSRAFGVSHVEPATVDVRIR